MITKICINIDGKEVELSVEKARELYNDLNQLFGQNTNWYYPIVQPIYPNPHIPWITYTSDMANTSSG